ncbi:MAG: glycosyltransferase family 2 protein [Luteolibacter sp.]
MTPAPSSTGTAPSPEVSVVMINYNGLPWLDTAIASVLATENVSIEVVVVDDCSSDDSREFLTQQAALDVRVRLVFLTENVGISGARNAGIDVARGAYVSIIDSDDRFLPDTVRKQLEAFARLRKEAPDLALLTSDAWLINEAGHRKGRYISKDWWDRESSVEPPLWTLPSTFFFRREGAARFHQGYRSADAPIFISRMARIGPIGFTGEPLIEYRLRMSSVTNHKGAHMLREMRAAETSRRMNRLDSPLSAEEVDAPPGKEVGAWIYGRNAKNAAANGRLLRAAWELTKAVVAYPTRTMEKLIRAFQTVGKRFTT